MSIDIESWNQNELNQVCKTAGLWWCVPYSQHSEAEFRVRGRWISMNLRSISSTKQVPEHLSRLHRETLSQKTKEKYSK